MKINNIEFFRYNGYPIENMIMSNRMMGGQSNIKKIDYEKLKKVVSEASKKSSIDGCFVLLKTPQGEFKVNYGTNVRNVNSPPTAETHIRIGSNTKSMTAAVIVLQAQEGKLNLNDSVSKYIPQVPFGDKITIELLLKMRSGLENYTAEPILSTTLTSQPSHNFTPQQLLNIAFKTPPYSLPDTVYHYCNTNYILLGLIAEKVDKKPLSLIFQQRLFIPLGLKNTLLPAPGSAAMPEPYSHGYEFIDPSYILMDRKFSPYVEEAIKAQFLHSNDITFANPSWAWAAGGVISTANDLAIWISSLISGKVFNRQYQQKFFSSFQSQDPNQPDIQSYGYGISDLIYKGNKSYLHTGQIVGYTSGMLYDPTNQITIVIWANLDKSVEARTPSDAILEQVLGQVYG